MDVIDLNQRAFFYWIMSTRLFNICLEMSGCLLILATSIFAVLSRNNEYAGLLGLALTSALQVTTFLRFAVRSVIELEGQMSSVEPVNYYIYDLPAEGEVEIEDAVTKEWPERGEIEFKDVQLRYREELPLVFKGINIKNKPSEKVGNVGRTGSAKSSMMMALLRMVETCGGRIMVDGVDLKTVGLNAMRSKMAIIPR